MGDYSQAAEFYDLLYAASKDYAAESAVLGQLIRAAAPAARRVLDVACGTGKHAEGLTALGFAVDGIDLEPAFVAIAARRCPEGKFEVADMTQLSLPQRYDAITCMFSSIGYANTPESLHRALAAFAAHLEPDGVVIIDPWFEPGDLTDGWIGMATGTSENVSVCRMQRTSIDGSISHLDFEYLIGSPLGIERRSERHSLGLFTREQMEAAFHGAGLTVQWREAALRRRGAYVGRLAIGKG
ncbi:MAG: class I SAM-dependent methyltransferase [bacterium]